MSFCTFKGLGYDEFNIILDVAWTEQEGYLVSAFFGELTKCVA